MSLLASAVMDQAASLLNDSTKALYTYNAQLPYLILANEELERELIVYGISIQRVKSDVIAVDANTTSLTLPADFVLPIKLHERNRGDSSQRWTPMVERNWEPDTIPAGTDLVYWSFRNNGIYFVGATTDRDVLLEYDRMLAVIQTQNSVEDFQAAKNYLSSRTAELCARFVGMNSAFADEIRDNVFAKASDNLVRSYVLNGQGTRHRKGRYRTQYLDN